MASIARQSFKRTRAGLSAISAAALVLNACSLQDAEGPQADAWGEGAQPASIVGGTSTNYKSFKGVVGLFVGEGYSGAICTATLIDSRVLLSAGHCVYLPEEGIDAVSNPSAVQVFGGANITSYSAIAYPNPQKVVKHPDWDGDIHSWQAVDLSLILLEEPIDSVEVYAVRSGDKPAVGEMGKIVGYGLASYYQPESAGEHRVGDAAVLAIDDLLIEVGNPAGTCQGDSGGPFFTEQDGQWVVTGVTSFGVEEICSADGGGYDVNVLAHRDWIDKTMMQLVGHGLGEDGGDTGGDGPGDPADPCADGSAFLCNPLTNGNCLAC